jgi:PEP-CTERM motif
MSADQSKLNWAQISISHHVDPGAPEIGHPVGVGFFARRDTAVDDATLTSVIPEPGTIILVGLGGLALVACRRRE